MTTVQEIIEVLAEEAILSIEKLKILDLTEEEKERLLETIHSLFPNT